jgi:aryl-alcohol dehydrogenase-like predicted oxidoreductase
VRLAEREAEMRDFRERRILGKTGLSVCPLGVASSFGAPTEALEEAFERGVNYFYWGSMRKTGMARAIRNILAGRKRDDLVIVIQSYSRSAALMELFYRKALKTLGIDKADVMLLGWHNKLPSPRVMDRAMEMKDKGLFRFLGLSGHNRPLFPDLAKDERFDLFHVRYNAAHRGAEEDIFARMPRHNRPGLVTYTATRWGDLLNPGKMPPGDVPLRGADCYRFALSHPMVDVCITGPKNGEEMKEALAALDLGPLREEELVRIRRIGDHVHADFKGFFFG